MADFDSAFPEQAPAPIEPTPPTDVSSGTMDGIRRRTNATNTNATTNTNSKVVDVMDKSEWDDVKGRVTQWSRSILAFQILIFLFLLVILVLFILWTIKADPVPDQSMKSFEWRPNEGGPYNSLKAGNMVFALWRDGNAYVVNTQDGSIIGGTQNNPTNSLPYSENRGGSMSLSDGELKLYMESITNPVAIAKAAGNSSGYTLNLLPTGTLFWRSSDGVTSPFAWEAAT